MTQHENELFIERSQVPLGWEPLAETGSDRGEAIALCVRIRESGRDAVIVVTGDDWHTVWHVAFRSWPYT